MCLLWWMLTISMCGSFHILGGHSENQSSTLVKLAPFNANWAMSHHNSAVQLQTHVHLFLCFIGLFVNTMCQSVDDIEGRKGGQLCSLWSVAGSMLITWHTDRISILRPGAPYFKGLMGWDGIDDHMKLADKHWHASVSTHPQWLP